MGTVVTIFAPSFFQCLEMPEHLRALVVILVCSALVFKFAERIGLNDVPSIIHEIEASLNAAAKQSVDVVPRPDSGDKDAPPNS